jgi:hypothetical protein
MTEPLDMQLKHDGKVIIVHIVINTDRNHYHLAKELRRVARGPRLDALLMWIEGYDGEGGEAVWKEMQKVAVKMAADPKATPFDDGGA